MIISTEQVRLALEYLQTSSSISCTASRCDVSPQLVERVSAALEALPDCREERVLGVRDRYSADPPSAEEIAEKMIGRIISDSLR